MSITYVKKNSNLFILDLVILGKIIQANITINLTNIANVDTHIMITTRNNKSIYLVSHSKKNKFNKKNWAYKQYSSHIYIKTIK